MVENKNGEWGLFALEDEEGYPLIVRFRKEYLETLKKAKYTTLASITWPYELSEENALPDKAVQAEHAAFEELLDPLDDETFSHAFIVYTGRGKKEWFWYAKDSETWINKLNELLANHPRFPIEILFAEDPGFEFYEYYDKQTGN